MAAESIVTAQKKIWTGAFVLIVTDIIKGWNSIFLLIIAYVCWMTAYSWALEKSLCPDKHKAVSTAFL